jgi:uncharacterized damage-inducible protein DinB
MKITETLVQELDLEARYTRETLARVPEDKLAWKAHEKSMTMGWLATFLAVLPEWGVMTVEKDAIDVASPETFSQRTVASSRQELLDLADRHTAAFRATLVATTDDHLTKPWSLLAAGHALLTQPRYLVLRTYVLNHIVHHRAQLGIYLRLNGIAVPAIYSDSADEKGGMFRD